MWCVTAALICFSLSGGKTGDLHILKLTKPTKTCNNSPEQMWVFQGPFSWKIDTERDRIAQVRLPSNAVLRDCGGCTGDNEECKPVS